MIVKKYFDTFTERKTFENTTKANILNYGIEYIKGIKKYYVLAEHKKVTK